MNNNHNNLKQFDLPWERIEELVNTINTTELYLKIIGEWAAWVHANLAKIDKIQVIEMVKNNNNKKKQEESITNLVG